MTLENVEYEQTSGKEITYRKTFRGVAFCASKSVGEFKVKFNFTVERHAVEKNIIKIDRIEDCIYPILNVKPLLVEWIGNNIYL